MSTDTIKSPNRLLADSEPILRFIETADMGHVRSATHVDWDRGIIRQCEPQLRSLLLAMGLVAPGSGHELLFDRKGRTFLGKILLDLDTHITSGSEITSRYTLTQPLASGKNSITFKADDTKLGRSVVLKFFRPGRGTGIIANIARLGRVKGEPILINPLDVLRHPVDGGHGYPLLLDVVVFPFVDGMTLRSYLASERNASPVVLQAFIEQTCIAMLALDKEGLNHGDLHPNNVLVTTDSTGRVAFRLIDVSYGADEPSDYEYALTDIEAFRHILRLAVADIQSRLRTISLRRHLGARIFTLVDFILNASSLTFEHIHREVHEGRSFVAFIERKAAFLHKRFAPPRDFGILRYEEFSDPNIAMQLFYPFPQLFERLCEFGSTVLFGHRGTGKSTYMAAMTFFPRVQQAPVNYKESFGILFACRQGEFRKFGSDYLRHVTRATKLRIKDILVTKIIRKTLGALAEGIQRERLACPQSLTAIAEFVLGRLQHTPGVMISHQVSELESITSILLQAEIGLIDRLFAETDARPQSELLDEQALKRFFEAVRSTFSELSHTRFAVLFDDAGKPNVPREVQSVICDLMASTNDIYCIKLSAEKHTFDFLTSNGKPIERIHDVRVYTVSDYLNIGSGFSSEWRTVEEYLRQLVGVRLRVSGFHNDDIRAYLGDSGMSAEDLVERLAIPKSGRLVYSGWRTVWQISDRTMRHLIEMISAIFDDAGLTPQSVTKKIPAAVQSRQIVRFSNDKLRGLMFLPGVIRIGGRSVPLGKLLYEFAASFGRISRYYLIASGARARGKTKQRRFDERLGIEIDNTLNLGRDAQRVLNALVQFAVVDDERMVTAFDDNMRKPVYVFNKVYCPVLKISYRRSDHWRLSSARFERLLLNPTEFVRTDAQLAKLSQPGDDDDTKLFE